METHRNLHRLFGAQGDSEEGSEDNQDSGELPVVSNPVMIVRHGNIEVTCVTCGKEKFGRKRSLDVGYEVDYFFAQPLLVTKMVSSRAQFNKRLSRFRSNYESIQARADVHFVGLWEGSGILVRKRKVCTVQKSASAWRQRDPADETKTKDREPTSWSQLKPHFRCNTPT